MKLYRIHTYDPTRRSCWFERFGAETLPVKSPKPREQELPVGTVLAFDLDASRLPQLSVDAFAHLLAQKHSTPFAVARRMVDGYPLPANNCTVVLERTAVATTWQERPFSFVGGGTHT